MAIVVACATTSSSDAPKTYDLSPTLEDAPKSGVVQGVVVGEDGVAIPSALVSIGGVTATSDGAGKFRLTAAAGRPALTVTAENHVPVVRTIGVTSASPSLRLELATRAADRIVAAGKATSLDLGEGTLEFGADAYAKGTKVSATWLKSSQLAAMSGRAIFLENDVQHRIIGQLHVEAEAQPAAPVTLATAAVADLPEGATLSLYALENGEPTAPISNTGTIDAPRFSLAHFSDYVEVVTLPKVGFGDAKMWTIGSTNGFVWDGSREYRPGDRVAPGTTLYGRFTIWAPVGAQVDNGGAAMKFDTDNDGAATGTCVEPCRTQVEVRPIFLEGSAQTGTVRKFMIRTKVATLGVRGTVFRFEETNCSEASKSSLLLAEVSEGAADLSLPGFATTVNAGKRARACDGCTNPKSTTCDCDPIACKQVGGKCLKCSDGAGYGRLLPDSPFCVPADATCCPGKGGTIAGLCSELTDGRPLCQCKGEGGAACATRNSRCLAKDPLFPERVLDCGLDPKRPIQCFHEAEPQGPLAHWSCDAPSDYLRDRKNCGSCGHACAGKNEICSEGKCVDCNNGCGDKVWCPNHGKCCTLQTAGFATSCIAGPDAVAPGCGPWSSQVVIGPNQQSCQ